MEFQVTLIEITEPLSMEASTSLKANCTHVDDVYWIMEGDVDALRDDGVVCKELAGGAVGSLGDLTKKELKQVCVGLLGYEEAAELGLNPQVERMGRDTSAGANASPVEHKHKAPPTPTIEELDMIDYIVTMRTLPEQGTDKIFAEMRLRLTKKSKAELALLITKARENELVSLKRKATEHCAFKINQSGSELDTKDVRLAVTVKNIDARISQLKATTQKDNNV